MYTASTGRACWLPVDGAFFVNGLFSQWRKIFGDRRKKVHLWLVQLTKRHTEKLCVCVHVDLSVHISRFYLYWYVLFITILSYSTKRLTE